MISPTSLSLRFPTHRPAFPSRLSSLESHLLRQKAWLAGELVATRSSCPLEQARRDQSGCAMLCYVCCASASIRGSSDATWRGADAARCLPVFLLCYHEDPRPITSLRLRQRNVNIRTRGLRVVPRNLLPFSRFSRLASSPLLSSEIQHRHHNTPLPSLLRCLISDTDPLQAILPKPRHACSDPGLLPWNAANSGTSPSPELEPELTTPETA